jgi:hypothetical protein
MDFLWPYVEHLSYHYKTGLFNELEWSIKSVKKNYQGPVRCFVVGDDPELEGVTHIPAKLIETVSYGYARHFDIIRKLQLSLPHLEDEFVLMYDDIYILNPVGIDDLKEVYARDPIDDIESYMRGRPGDMSYKSGLKSTLHYIKDHLGRDDLYDWETHLPRYFVKSGIEFLIRESKLDMQNVFITSLYPAYYSGTPNLGWKDVQYDIWTWTPAMTDELDENFKKLFLNLTDDALVPSVIKKIKKCLS